MTEVRKYKALVEADAILVPRRTFESEEEAREYIEETVNTGDLGPPKIRAIEVAEFAEE